jgi:hypothetical protein
MNRGLVPVVPAAFAIAVYAPLILRRSAWSDDLPFLLNPGTRKLFADGRPVFAVLNRLAFSSADTISGLTVVRGLGLLGIAFLLAYLTRLLLELGWSPKAAILTGMSIGLLPPFHAYAGWATVFSFPWVMLLSAFAGRQWLKALEDRRRANAGFAMVAMTLALLTYPPAAMFCWAWPVLRLLCQPAGPRSGVVDARRTGLLVALSGSISLLIARLTMALLDIQADPRFQFIDSMPDLVEKARWFVTRPVAIAVRPFIISSPSDLVGLFTAIPVLIFLTFGLLLRFEGTIVRRLATMAILGLMASLTMLSHLLSVDNQVEYRFMAGLIVVTWIALVVAGRELLSWALTRFGIGIDIATIGVLAMSLVIVPATVAALRNVNQVFVRPAVIKEDHLLEQLSGFDPEQHHRLIVIDAPGSWPTRQNLGIYSVRTDLAHSWVIEANLRLLLAESFDSDVTPEIWVVDEPSDPRTGELVVDLRPLVSRL